jgi:Phosphoinositide phospholipase C, Ca2+-dependent
MGEVSFPATHPASYHEVAFKASHNSYARKEQPITEQIPFDRAEPEQAGCRGLELDIAPSETVRRWSVAHSSKYKPEAPQLRRCLRHLSQWSDNNPGHDVITLTLDIKRVPAELGRFPRLLDDYIARDLDPAMLFSPSELLGDHDTLLEAIPGSWPTLGDLTGRFVICLSGAETAKKRYAESSPDRLCFADRKISPNRELPMRDLEWRVFLNIDMGAWLPRLDKLRDIATQYPFVKRAYFVNEEPRWNAARSARLNIIATDKIRQFEWAKISDGLPFDLA